MKTKLGFTLIELLVVVAIISILATIGLVMYSGTQKQARIAKRIEDLRNIKVALEIYYTRNNTYPTTTNAWRSQCGGTPSDQVIPGNPPFIPNYMVSFPADPAMNPATNIPCYRYKSDGNDYKLYTYQIPTFEMGNTEYRSQPNLIDPARDNGSECYKVETLGNATAWAIYSTNTGIADAANNPACWD